MRPKFVYILSEKDKETLLGFGYSMIHADKYRSIFVFENNPSLNSYLQNQSCDDSEKAIAYVMTDVLTF